MRFGGIPRSILTMQPREPGASGAVSLAGTAGSALGALMVGLVGGILLGSAAPVWAWVAVAGFAAGLVDSALGDSLQATYVCGRCGEKPEVARHGGCGARATRISGLAGLDNDVVNWITSFAGAALALALRRCC